MCVWGTNTAGILDRQRGSSQTAGEPDDRSHFKSDKHSEWMMTFIVIYEVSDFLAVWLLLWPVLIGRGCFSFSLRRSVFHSHQHCTNIWKKKKKKNVLFVCITFCHPKQKKQGFYLPCTEEGNTVSTDYPLTNCTNLKFYIKNSISCVSGNNYQQTFHDVLV